MLNFPPLQSWANTNILPTPSGCHSDESRNLVAYLLSQTLTLLTITLLRLTIPQLSGYWRLVLTKPIYYTKYQFI